MLGWLAVAASLASLLPPPRLVKRGKGRHEIIVPVTEDGLSIRVYEASLCTQEVMVEEAFDSTAPIGSEVDDPYGVVLWPAAQVVANRIATLPAMKDATVLELGAGTGLCSLTALRCGAKKIVATDYRKEPLALLREAASVLPEDDASARLETSLFDIKSDQKLPAAADYLVAADLLYQKSTSICLAQRCVEALRVPPPNACREVLVGDLGRPGRQAFLDELVRQGVKKSRARFEETDGWMPAAPRHEFVSSRSGDDCGGDDPAEAQPVRVGMLRLTAEDLE